MSRFGTVLGESNYIKNFTNNLKKKIQKTKTKQVRYLNEAFTRSTSSESWDSPEFEFCMPEDEFDFGEYELAELVAPVISGVVIIELNSK